MRLLLLLLLLPTLSFCQTIEERLILTDEVDSALINATGGSNFNANGGYCFIIKKGESQYFAVTDKGTIGPFRSTSSAFGKSGGATYLYDSYKEDKPFYYKNSKGTRFFGPLTGKREHHISDYSTESIALTITHHDSLYFYINDKQVGRQLKNKNNIIENDDWCTFSRNGNALYYIPIDSFYVLYANGTPIDTSIHRFIALSIINDGSFVYAKGQRPQTKGKYRFFYTTCTKDSTIGPVRTVWKYFHGNDGSYYHSGDDNGPEYITINNRLFKNIDAVDNIILADKHNFLFSFNEGNTKKLNVNGKTYTADVPHILHPSLDTLGNFSFYGVKDYFLYRYINGRQEEKPISRYGVRATPLFINPTGSSIHYFKTDDSVYLYKDDSLMLSPVIVQNFRTDSYTSMMGAYPAQYQPNGLHHLSYFEIDSTGYFLYDGGLSRPMKNVKHQTISNAEIGSIIMGNFDEVGFFVIQKTGDKAYTINVNNTSYKTLYDIDKLYDENWSFDGKKLVLFGKKGLSFYQYTLTL